MAGVLQAARRASGSHRSAPPTAMVYAAVWPAACVPAESEGGCEETVTVGELTMRR